MTEQEYMDTSDLALVRAAKLVLSQSHSDEMQQLFYTLVGIERALSDRISLQLNGEADA